MAKKKIDLTPIKAFFVSKGEKLGIAAAGLALVGLAFYGFMTVGAYSSDKQGRSFQESLTQEAAEFDDKLRAGSSIAPTQVAEGAVAPWSPVTSSYSQRPYFQFPEVVVNKRNTPFMAALNKDNVKLDYVLAGVLRYDLNTGPGRRDFGTFSDGKEIKDTKEAKDTLPEFAWQVETRRMVVVSTSFPIRSQLEEFRLAFLLETQQQVLKNPKDRPSFLGLIVHRQEMPSGEWELLYHYKPELMPKEMREALRDCILDEANPKANQGNIYPGLVTPLPKLAQFADPPKPAENKDKDKDKDKGPVARKITYVSLDKLPKRFQQQYENFNPLDPLGLPFEQSPYRGPDLAKYAMAPTAKEAKEVKAIGDGDEKPIDIKDIPDALVRFVDPTVKVNKTYRYKMEVRLRNPNFERPDEVNYPQLAQIAELRARKGEQEVVTAEVSIPEEFFYLAGDLQPMANYARGADFLPARPEQVPIHLQRFVEMAVLAGGVKPVANWAICERLLHRRGDTIGAPIRGLARDPARDQDPQGVWTDVPVWDKEFKGFVLEKETVPNTYYRGAFGVKIDAGGIPLDFALRWMPEFPHESKIWTKSPVFADDFAKNKGTLWGKSPVLVDFDGGRRDKWTLQNGVSVIKDESGAELLILNPDLSLTSRSARADYELMETGNPLYKARVETWRAQVRSVKPAGGDAGKPPPIKGILDK